MAYKAKAKKKTCKPLPKTKVIGGKRFTNKGAKASKAAAQKSAKLHRSKGKNKGARVVQDPCSKKWCVLTRG